MSSSEAPSRFDELRGKVALILGPLLFVILLLAPLPLALEAHRLAAVMALTVIFWIGEPIPVAATALLGPTLAIIVGAVPGQDPKTIAVTAYAKLGDPILLLFLGGFFIAEAMTAHGLDRRLAMTILSRRAVSASPARMMTGLGIVAFLLSMWLSNTATTAMLLPIALGMLKLAYGEKSGGSAAQSTMLLLAFAAGVGGLGTPLGTPPNLVGIAQLETLAHIKIGFVTWMALAVPIATAMLIVLIFMLTRGLPNTATDLHAYARKERAALGAWSKGELITVIAFGTAVVLWIGAGLAPLFCAPSVNTWLAAHLPEGVIAILAASLLFLPLLPDGQPALTWKNAARIDWGTLLLLGGGLCLGDLMLKTGLAKAVGHGLVNALGVSSLWSITALATGLAILITEFASNTAAATMVVPVVIGIAQGAQVSPIPPALGATIGASLAFMLPISTPPNALVYGTGLIPITVMVRRGIWFDFYGFLIILAGLYLLCPLLGLG